MNGATVTIEINKREPSRGLSIHAPIWLADEIDAIAKAEISSVSAVGVALLKAGLLAYKEEKKRTRR